MVSVSIDQDIPGYHGSLAKETGPRLVDLPEALLTIDLVAGCSRIQHC